LTSYLEASHNSSCLFFGGQASLNDGAIRLCYGETGIYFVFLKDLPIQYPVSASRLIYIGMSESMQNSIGRRLRDHASGQSGNLGISNYAKYREVYFTYHTLEVLQHCGTSNLFDIESLFLQSFSTTFGCYPICNGQSGHEILSEESRKITLSVDWAHFQ